jgi:hypothetical protein
MQRLHPLAIEPRAHPLTNVRGDRRHRRQAAGERLEIKAAAADKNRQAAVRARLSKRGRGIGDPGAGGKIHAGIDMAIEPVRNTRLFLHHRPRRQDAEIAVDLHGIGVDDGTAEPFRKRKRKRRLAAGGRPCDKHGIARLHQ